uniref:testicular haploid expressed gene protein n=1 Tax=Jaculus jaculus TaxID=51337 RepID=UPI001E1B3652|nr:testicular haploid expressed gene protein [Jaculus jaculus]
MGEPGAQRTSLPDNSNPDAKAEGGSAQEPGDGGPAPQSTVYESRWLRDPARAELGLDDPEEEILPEEMAKDEIPEVLDPEEALEQDLEEEVIEISQLSVTDKPLSTSTVGGRSRRRRRRSQRLLELSKPKTNWQTFRDRMGCCCKGYAWIAPRKTNLQFCLYWPSVYWTKRFLEDTTLTITVPAVSHRVEELARPRRFFSEYYNNNRTTPIWPIPRSTLEYQPTNRLKELAVPKVRNNIWNMNMSEVSQVSRAAQMAVPTPRIVQLSKPKVPAALMEEWDPMPKPKPHVSDYHRLLQLAMPKAQSDQCVPDRSPRWEVLDVTKKAVASPRIISLAQPKVRKDLNEGYDRHPHASTSLPHPKASPRKCDHWARPPA